MIKNRLYPTMEIGDTIHCKDMKDLQRTLTGLQVVGITTKIVREYILEVTGIEEYPYKKGELKHV